MLLEKAALRRLILPAVLRELFLTGCALTPAVLAHCEESYCCLWSQDFPYKIAENPEKNINICETWTTAKKKQNSVQKFS